MTGQLTRRGLLGLAVALALPGCTALGGARPRRVLVAGATGGTGRAVVEALQVEGTPVRVLVRDAAAARQLLGAGPELAAGNVLDPASLAAACAGVDAVVSCIGARAPDGPDRPEKVDYEGVRNLAAAAAAARAGQFVLVSSRGVTGPESEFSKGFGNILAWKLKGEEAVRASGVPWTIVRPGGLNDQPGGRHGIVLEQGDRPLASTVIPRADVAAACVAALREPAARYRTFELLSVPGTPPTDWAAAFGALLPDPRV